MSRKLFVASSMIALACTFAAFAQQPDRPAAAPRAAPGQGTSSAQWKSTDHALASCVAAANQVEVAIGQFASEKTQNEEVQNFAMMLVRDHTDFLQKISKFAPESSREGYLMRSETRTAETKTGDAKAPGKVAQKSPSPAAATDDPNNPNRVQYTAGFRPGEAFPHSQIERELAQQCLATAKEKLGAKTGAEFDKCFIGSQIAAHIHMKDKLVVFQRHTSAELGQLLAAAQKKTEEHLAKAEELMQTLDHARTSDK